jgi:hypothetical protein
MAVAAINSFWGKARPIGDAAPHWHPLAWHMLDVGACAQAILEVRPGARRVVTRSLGLQEAQAVRLTVLVAALHDLGKFAAPFQQKAMGPEWPFAKPRDAQFGASERLFFAFAYTWHTDCFDKPPQNRSGYGTESPKCARYGALF